MRHTRLIAAVLALALALSLAVGVLEATGAVGATADRDQARKPRHELVVKGKEPAPGRFVLYGRVLTYDGRIALLRSVARGPYRELRTVRVDGHGRFATRIHQSRGRYTCFKVEVPGTETNRRTVSRGAFCITR